MERVFSFRVGTSRNLLRCEKPHLGRRQRKTPSWAAVYTLCPNPTFALPIICFAVVGEPLFRPIFNKRFYLYSLLYYPNLRDHHCNKFKNKKTVFFLCSLYQTCSGGWRALIYTPYCICASCLLSSNVPKSPEWRNLPGTEDFHICPGWGCSLAQ